MFFGKDIVQIIINGFQIINVYKELNILEMIKFVIKLKPFPRIFIEKDFNVKYNSFELNVIFAIQKVILI